MAKKFKDIWQGLSDKEKKLFWKVAAILVVGIILMAVSSNLGNSGSSEDPTAFVPASNVSNNNIANITEEKVADILREIKGAGKVTVAIQMAEGSTYEYLFDTEESRTENITTSADSGSSISEETKKQNLAMADKSPVLAKEYLPRIQGVVVVAEGAGDAQVRENIFSAVKALLGLAANQIAVLESK
jgi:stage III sporulation protein AG